MPESIKILKVRLDKVTLNQALSQIQKWLEENSQHYVTTPNPEIILKAQKDKKYLKILNGSSLNVADGIGILWAATFLSTNKNIYSWISTLLTTLVNPSSIKKVLTQRVTGTDLMEKICQIGKHPIFLLGAGEGIAKRAAEKFPEGKIVGTYSGSPKEQEEKTIVEKINNSNAEVLFVAFGAPSQEKWIARNLKKMPKVKVAIGVGGAFNFHAGIIKRAPKWMQSLGLEWLFRLIKQPSRIKRIYNATIKFPIEVYKQRLK